MKNYEIHPFALKFPQLDDDGIDKLSKDIKKHGLRLNIVLYEDKILDGRNRYLACKKAGVEPRFDTFEESDGSPLSYVWSMNDHRRHLTQSQRAAIAVEFLPEYEKEAALREKATQAKPGEKVGKGVAILPPPTNIGKSREKAAEAAGVSPRMVQDAKKLGEDAPEELRKVKDGEKTIGHAKKDAAKRYPPPPADDVVIRDSLKKPIPKKLLALWNRRDEVQSVLTQLSRLRSMFRKDMDKLAKERDHLWAEMNFQSVMAALSTAYADVAATMPYTICPTCEGDGDGCKSCGNRGMIGKFRYDTQIPTEYK